MMKTHNSVILLPLTAVMLVASGWAPESGEVSGPLASAADAREERRAGTSLILAVQNEPINFMSVTYGGSPSQGGTQHGRYIAHNFLVVQDETGAWVPQLALTLVAGGHDPNIVSARCGDVGLVHGSPESGGVFEGGRR